jgi:ribosomal protein L34
MICGNIRAPRIGGRCKQAKATASYRRPSKGLATRCAPKAAPMDHLGRAHWEAKGEVSPHRRLFLFPSSGFRSRCGSCNAAHGKSGKTPLQERRQKMRERLSEREYCRPSPPRPRRLPKDPAAHLSGLVLSGVLRSIGSRSVPLAATGFAMASELTGLNLAPTRRCAGEIADVERKSE